MNISTWIGHIHILHVNNVTYSTGYILYIATVYCLILFHMFLSISIEYLNMQIIKSFFLLLY